MSVLVVSNGLYWQARFKDSLGNTRRISLGAKAKLSERDARSRAFEIHAEHVRNPASMDRRANPTIREWEQFYFANRPELAYGTQLLFTQTFGKLVAYFKNTRINDIKPVHAQAWRTWLSTTPTLRTKPKDGLTLPPISDQSVCRHVRDAKAIWAFAVKLQFADSNPFAVLRGTPAKVEHDWQDVTREDLVRLLEACPSPAWRNLFALCRLAGLRLGEALRARYEDIDQGERTLRVLPKIEGGVRRETTKQRARTVPICPDLWEMIGNGGSGAIAPVPTSNLHRNATAIVAKAGLPVYEKPFHTLRKNLETEWADQHPPMTVCKWLGHSPQVAAEHYVRASKRSVAAVTGGVDPLAEAHKRIADLEAKLALASQPA